MTWYGTIGDLIKYKLSLAVVLSAITGYLTARSFEIDEFIFMTAGVFLLAAGSSILNQYTERDTDRLMQRTKNRAIASGAVKTYQAMILVFVLFSGGILSLWQNGINPVLLGIMTVVLYNIVYTRLKKISILSVIPGSLVGSVPPLIGFYSAGAETLNPTIVAFSVFMFIWQIPHFWLIVIRYGEEYKLAGLASVSSYFNEYQLKKIIFLWFFITNSILIIFFFITGIIGLIIPLIMLITYTFFNSILFRSLFKRNNKNPVSSSILLINLHGLIIMFLLITASLI